MRAVPAVARALLRAAAPLLLAGSGACVSMRSLPELDWNPLVRIEHKADGAVEVEALGPLVNVRSGPEGVSYALRPLFQHKQDGPVNSVNDWLAPLGRTFTDSSGTKFRFWPLIWAGEMTDTPAGTDWGGVFFPIIFAGNGPGDDDGYFAIFPLAGRTRKIFGIDEFDFFLWPLFMRTHMDVTESSNSWTVLLLAGWTTGGPRDGSWRLLPFYRHRLWRNTDGVLRTDQQTVLWPFFTWGDDHLDTNDPSTRYAFWPFFSWESNNHWMRSTYLWPFFRVNRSRDPSVEDGGEFLYDLPWPIYRNSRSKNGSTFRIFPLYSHQVSPEVDSTAFLIPLGWWRKIEGRTSEEGFPPRDTHRADFRFFPFFHKDARTVDGRPGADTELQVWPLFHRDIGARGREDMAAPSLLPGRELPFLKPADELYSFLWTLWRHRSDGVSHETRLLFDTVMWRTGPEGTRVSIPFLYSQRPEAGGVSEHQVLWGLLGARTDDAGLSDVSVLGIPLWER